MLKYDKIVIFVEHRRSDFGRYGQVFTSKLNHQMKFHLFLKSSK